MNKTQKGLYLAGKALAVAQGVRSIINSEKKTFDSDLGSAVDTTGYTVPVTVVPQGDDYNQRDGRSILAKSLQLKFSIEKNASSTASQRVRFIVWQDTSGQGATPSLSTLFGTSAWVDALRDSDPIDMKRFKVLLDRTYHIAPGSGRESFTVDWFKKMHLHLKFGDATGGSQNKDRIMFSAVSSIATASNPPEITGTARLRYYDN